VGEFDTPEKWDAHLRDLSRRFAAVLDDEHGDSQEAYAETQSAWEDFGKRFGLYSD
jgi:hypothetical protein